MVTVQALTGFDHHGNKVKNSRFHVSDQTAKELSRAGLVRIIEDRPIKAVGKLSSASPAVQALPQQTVKPSGRGGRRQKAEASS